MFRNRVCNNYATLKIGNQAQKKVRRNNTDFYCKSKKIGIIILFKFFTKIYK